MHAGDGPTSLALFSALRGIFLFQSQFRQYLVQPCPPCSPTGTYLPIRVVAPVGGPCQSHGPGIRISASCTQDKMPCSAAPWAPGHGGQDLEESTRSEQRKTYDTPVGPPAPPALGPQPTQGPELSSQAHTSLQCPSTLMKPRWRAWNAILTSMTLKCLAQPLSELGLRIASVPPAHPSSISNLACPSSILHFDKRHL